MQRMLNQSGSIPSSILSGTPEAPSIFAACPSVGFEALGDSLGPTPGVAELDIGSCDWLGDSILTGG